jgi:multicomponent Na+:H+ antiporter subunit E
MLRLPLYLVWLLKEIVVSGVDVSKRMWQIEPEISPSIAWLPTNLIDDLSLTAYGNSITITPGTMTTGITSEGMVQVHALTEEAMEGLRGGDMAGRVANLVNYKE